MADASDRVLSFAQRELDVGGERRKVLVARPAYGVRLDAQRLERMRKGDFVSRVDMEILQAVGAELGAIALVVFDAASHDEQLGWAFDPGLEDEQRMELGHLLLGSQLALYRELVRMKSSGLVGIGFGSFELAAFQRGTVRVVTELSNELESAEPARAAQIEIDLWLIEHAATWTGLPLDQYFETKIVDEIASRDAKRPEIEQLLAAAADLT
jgi:hypothetical protein